MKHDWHTPAEARRAIFRYIETWYNRERRHSTLGYVIPAEYEAQLQLAAQFLSRTRPLFGGKSKLLCRSGSPKASTQSWTPFTAR